VQQRQAETSRDCQSSQGHHHKVGNGFAAGFRQRFLGGPRVGANREPQHAVITSPDDAMTTRATRILALNFI